MDIKIEKVNNPEELESIFRIREEVFVVEQRVKPEEEYDEFEEISVHFRASVDGIAAGTARWRFTDTGIKLERFAVLKSFRGKGVGQALVAAVLEDINRNSATRGRMRYLHAQVSAVKLYEKFGFIKIGEPFMECDISHYKMKLEVL